MNSRFVSGIILLLCLMVGCGNNLTREKAFEIINAALPKPIKGALPIGDQLFHDHSPRNLAIMKKLSNDGVINLVFISRPIPESQVYKISLTDKGKDFSIKFDKSGMGSGTPMFIILLGERSLVKISGMKMTNDNKKAEVEFEWKVVNLTPFGKALQNNSGISLGELIQVEMPIKSNETIYQGTATLSLYDDGWRVAKDSLKIGPGMGM